MTTTLTFGEVAENGPGMQKLGRLAPEGLTLAELTRARDAFVAAGCECALVDLVAAAELPALPGVAAPEPAWVLVVRGGAAKLAPAAALAAEQKALTPDKKAIFRGEVKNKLARWNLTFGDEPQEPDYEAGRGRIVPFGSLPALATVRAALPVFFGPKTANLLCEGNYYYAPTCGIGFHGDGERRIVIAMRLGRTMPFHYQWFVRFKPVGKRIIFEFADGDLYAMSHKAVGTDWKRSSLLTLRHAAGARKYLEIKQ